MASGEETTTTQEERPEESAEVAEEKELTDEEIAEMLLDDGQEDGPEEALFAICLAAQTDRDFGPSTVMQVLKALDLQGYWEEAKLLAAAESDDA